MRQKYIRNASEMLQKCVLFYWEKRNVPKCVRNASKMRQKCVEHLWGEHLLDDTDWEPTRRSRGTATAFSNFLISVRMDYHRSSAQPGFRAGSRAISGHFQLSFSCGWGKEGPEKNPRTRVSWVKCCPILALNQRFFKGGLTRSRGGGGGLQVFGGLKGGLRGGSTVFRGVQTVSRGVY